MQVTRRVMALAWAEVFDGRVDRIVSSGGDYGEREHGDRRDFGSGADQP